MEFSICAEMEIYIRIKKKKVIFYLIYKRVTLHTSAVRFAVNVLNCIELSRIIII